MSTICGDAFAYPKLEPVMHFAGPKARHKPAQGNALGNKVNRASPERAKETLSVLVPPFQDSGVSARQPRALPWAGMFWAFGPPGESVWRALTP